MGNQVDVAIAAQRQRPRTAAARAEHHQRAHARQIALTDVAIVLIAVFGAHLLRFGFSDEQVTIRDSTLGLEFGYLLTSTLIAGGWLLALQLFGSRDPSVLGTGAAEYRRIADATVRVFGVIAILSLIFQIEFGRFYLLLALPAGLAMLILARVLWRRWLRAKRRSGEFLQTAIVIGDRGKTEHIAREILREPESGIRIVGAVTTRGSARPLVGGVPVIGSFDDVLEIIDATDVDAVILSTADAITPQQTRQLGWILDQKHIDLIVAPALTDIAGPRIHTRPVAGLPLIHVGYPRFEAPQRVAKRTFDIVSALGLILVFAPVMLAVAIAVKASSRGPVFYTQERVGLRGKPFRMLKFRSMAPDADQHLKELLEQQGKSDQPLFKVNEDPRVTPVGRVIRKYSLDELPQFFNVLTGTMSLVGPRPQRDAEVELYDDHAHRRLFMKPGLTGLWQVSGRSDLSWEDAIRLDLYYVENWSITTDIVIVARTLAVLIRPSGAY